VPFQLSLAVLVATLRGIDIFRHRRERFAAQRVSYARLLVHLLMFVDVDTLPHEHGRWRVAAGHALRMLLCLAGADLSIAVFRHIPPLRYAPSWTPWAPWDGSERGLWPLPRALTVAAGLLAVHFAVSAIDAFSCLAAALLGLHQHARHRNPFAASCQREFWGKRWNGAFGSALRSAFFHPAAHAAKRGAERGVGRSELSMAIASFATFALSGVLHAYPTLVALRQFEPAAAMQLYFLLAGAGVQLERSLRLAHWPAGALWTRALGVSVLAGGASMLLVPVHMTSEHFYASAYVFDLFPHLFREAVPLAAS
jgi:hypothetical protein